MYNYFLNAFSVSFIVFVTLFKKKETYLISQNALKGPVKVRSRLFWNKNADIYSKFQKCSSFFDYFVLTGIVTLDLIELIYSFIMRSTLISID